MKRRADEQRLQDMLQKFKKSQEKERERKSQKKQPRPKAKRRQKSPKAYFRKYNKSQKGRERSRRYRQSPYGKAKLREKYEERKKVLAAEFARLGCCVCGEKDGRVLRALPGKGGKLRFAPTSMNASRSLRSWREMLRQADILCLNCLGKRSLAATADELPENSVQLDASDTIEPEESKIRENSPFPERVKIKAPQKAAAANCVCCEGEFRQKWAWQRCCSRECQLLYLAARTFLRAYLEGRGNGLQWIITELAGVRRQ